MAAQQSGIELHLMRNNSISDSVKFKEMLSPRLPFGLPTGKLSQSINYEYAGKHQLGLNMASGSNINSPRISQDDTHLTSTSI